MKPESTNQKYMQGRKTDKRLEGSQNVSEMSCKKNLKCSIYRTREEVSPVLTQTSACIYFHYYKLKALLFQYGCNEIIYLFYLKMDANHPTPTSKA
jgi:hypothetical protein